MTCKCGRKRSWTDLLIYFTGFNWIQTGKVHTGFWWANLKDRGTHGRIILKCKFKKWDGGMDWIGIGTGGGHL